MTDRKTLTRLLFTMLQIRRVEEAIADEYSKQEMRCPTHLAIGQEAIAAGVSLNLTKADIVFSSHRSHAHYLAKGASLPAMIAELYGKETGCSGGFGGSQHLIDLSVNFWGSAPIVASTVPVAVGAALSVKMKKEKRIVVVFFGEAATEEGVTWESLNYAALRDLPILFVCENNLYSTNTHIRERQPDRPIYKIAAAMGVPAYTEDGNDVLKVYGLSGRVIHTMRRRGGPAFLEFPTYRYREHCGPNVDPEGFRPKSEVDAWKKKDPLKRLLMKSRLVQTLEQKIRREIRSAFDFAKKSPSAKSTLSASTVYAP